jgi:hypothetical protein
VDGVSDEKRSLSFEVRGLQTVLCVGYSKEAKKLPKEERANEQRQKEPKPNNNSYHQSNKLSNNVWLVWVCVC